MNQLEHIVAFVRVAELGSYTRAADTAHHSVEHGVLAIDVYQFA